VCNIPEDSRIKIQCISIRRFGWFKLLEEEISVYSENHSKPINTVSEQNAELLIVKADGACV
jgi:hypothetical protein